MAAQQFEPCIRPVKRADADECGRICYQAFASIAQRHGFPPDFPSIDVATSALEGLIDHPGFYGVVAESGGRIVGANFLDERSSICSVGPVVVDPDSQDCGVGAALMSAVLQRSAESNPPGVRLLQAGYHNRSLSLYTKLGFRVRDSFAVMHGSPLRLQLSGYHVRPAVAADLASCNELCRRVHGHDRRGELTDALAQDSAMVVQRGGRITGYTTGIGFYSHSVAESDDDLIALIAAADEIGFGAGFLVPLRNIRLMQWCLAHGFRIAYTMNLMSLGLYQEPQGAFLASVGY